VVCGDRRGKILAVSFDGTKEQRFKRHFHCLVDGLKGFPDAIKTVYPDAKIQLCIVHMVETH